MVARQVVNPVRHSSCAIAGRPNLFAAMTWACSCASRALPSSGSIGGTAENAGQVPEAAADRFLERAGAAERSLHRGDVSARIVPGPRAAELPDFLGRCH